ncbi:glucosylceramidase [Vibrio sp. SM6]|uniref:Glucosylceramidase n=1 Tax=Vibrio agarilyticus TaxID=2726741 RepID=A0A7X8TNW2_9VIBR|nr:GH116 family glycosyl hydrolase [Vibrio agarilyticus]NLS12200.1 glucosylceramidase [Vibrio agarilyticus]
MDNRIPYTSFHGSAASICAKGNAVEFIQPWYTPISTTPKNTGIAVGGIGNTFTLTPLGDTPSFAFIPGIFIDNSNSELNFNDFYLSVADDISLDNLLIANLDQVRFFLRFYPALFCGEPLDTTSLQSALNGIKNALASGTFYLENQANFVKWRIELTSKTERELALDPRSIKAQLLVAVDFFNGLLCNSSAKLTSLTATPNQRQIAPVSEDQINFAALYPMAEFEYSPFSELEVTRKVVSPIVRGDKKLCSLPMHWNEFEIVNHSAETKIVTLAQSLKNVLGATYRKQRPGVQDSACLLTQNPVKQQHTRYQWEQNERTYVGVVQRSDSHFGADIDGEILFGVEVASEQLSQGKAVISAKPSLYCMNEEQVLIDALKTGRVNQTFDKGIYSGREALASVVTVQLEIAPHSSASVRFVQVMDSAKIELQEWSSEKAYAQYYSASSRATAIFEETFASLDSIDARIHAEQQTYLKHARAAFESDASAVQFATMAMNSLSFLAEATVWDVKDKFLVKECVDYPFFNSLDVYFYGSFSLLYLLPELDGCVMQEFARAILAQDGTKRRFWEYEDKPYAELESLKYEGVRGVKGAVIHDLGSPFDIAPDAYTWHNVKEWKDLAPKYALMVYRHYQLTGDASVVNACWPAVKESMTYLNKLIAQGDVMPLTNGTDDTFDNLSSHGISIYCGSLWVAGLRAAAELAILMNEAPLAQQYRHTGDASLALLERGLWDENRGYFRFFITPVQAKHLTGEGYQPLQALGLVLTGDNIKDKEILNRYLDQAGQASVNGRIEAKKRLLELAPDAFTQEYLRIVELDSDNSFGDAMLADTYLKLLGMPGLFAEEKVSQTLDFIYRTNFKENSPSLGVANMTLSNGMPHHEFQAQDVWVGVQFSAVTALKLAGKERDAQALIETVYHALYHEAKIPFAAPEGFNCSVKVSSEMLSGAFALSEGAAEFWYRYLKQTQCLLPDGRVNPFIDGAFEQFQDLMRDQIEHEEINQLYIWLKNTGLKYTAGRYFRPGMIFSYLPELLH